MLMELMIPCPFCGQLVAVEAESEPDEAKKEQMAKENCRCDGAKGWRMALGAYEKIDRIVGEGALEAGFDFAEGPDTVDALKALADDVIAHRYRQAEVVTPGGDKVRLTLGSNEINVRRTSKRQISI